MSRNPDDLQWNTRKRGDGGGQCRQDLLIYWTQLQWSIDLDVLLIKDECMKVVLHSSLHDFVCKYWPCIDETLWWWNWTLNIGFRSLSCFCVFSCKWTYQSVENTWLFLVTSLKKGISALFTLENYIVEKKPSEILGFHKGDPYELGQTPLLPKTSFKSQTLFWRCLGIQTSILNRVEYSWQML